VWHLPRLCQGRTQGKAKCGKNRFKTLIHFTTRHRYIAISQKWLKIDWYMQRGILQALNPLSIHVTFTAIVPRGVPRGGQNVQKMCQNDERLKFKGWITVKRLKIDGYMLRCVWQALNHLFIHVTFTAIVPGAYPTQGRLKCALDSLAVAKCLHPQNGWRQRHTAVTILR